jgi:hypothetical protein
MKRLEDLIQSRNVLDEVRENGWLRATFNKSENDLAAEILRLAQQIGKPIPGRRGRIIEALVPLPPKLAAVSSLSKLYGLEAFPIHTDGAHKPVPPRFIILACANPGTTPAPTVLGRLRDLALLDSERECLGTAVFLIRNGRRSFYSTILDSSRSFIRFDQGCMVPTCPKGTKTLHTITSRGNDFAANLIFWNPWDVLIVDNWNVLHGRGFQSGVTSSDRLLLRVSIQ